MPEPQVPTAPPEPSSRPPVRMIFEMTAERPLDQTIVDNQQAAAAEDLMRREQEQAQAAAQPAPTPQPAEAPPPELPSRGIAQGGGPSPAEAAITAGAEAVTQAVGKVAEGFTELPSTPIPGARKILIEGILPALMSPLTAAFAGAGQALENISPETADTEIFDASTASWLRTMLAGKVPKELTPEERAAFNQPMTVRDALQTFGPMVAPAVPGMVKGAAQAVRMAGPQRGSIGPPPEGVAFQGAKAGEPTAPSAAPEIPVPPPGAEARLNVGRIATSETVKATISDLSKFAGERLAKHREVKAHAETIAEAAAGRWTLEQMLTHEPETILVDEAKALRLRDTMVAAAEFYDTIGKRALAGDEKALAQLNDAYAVAVKLAALDEAQGRNLARGLEMRKEPSVGARAAVRATSERILEVSRKLGESEVDPLLAYRRVAALSEAQKRNFFVQLWNGLRAGRDIAHAAWINALLTNPKTHAANLGGTGLIVYGDIAETYAAGWINKLLTRDPDGVQRIEAGVKLRSWAEAHQDGIRLMGEAWQTGREPFGIGKTTEHPRIAAETYGFSPDSWFGQTIDAMGHALQSKATPTHALIAEDAYWKGVAYRMEIKALAMREAIAEGLEGPALAKRVGDLEANPTVDIIAGAQDQAVLLTLNKELGPIGKGLMQAANAIPGGRVLFPFMRTPGNSFKWVGQRAPVLSMLSTQNWNDLLAGGARRDKAIARTALGNAVAVAVAWEVLNGTITGGGPPNKNLAALQRDPNTSTKPPYSICPAWSDQCYGYNRLDPVGAYLGAIADYVELTSRIPDNQEALDEWAAWSFALVSAIGTVSISKNWMQGLRNVLDAQRDPTSGGARLLANFSKSIIPAGVREVARESDDNILRDVRSIREALLSGIPGLAATVPPRRNPITGEAIQYAPGWGPDIISPILVTKITDSPVWTEIQLNEANIPPVPDAIGRPPKEGPQTQPSAPATGVKLTDEEKSRLIDLQTQVLKDTSGRTLFAALEHLVASRNYQNQSTGRFGGRKILLEATYRGFHDKAIAQLERERFGTMPTLKERIREVQKEAIKPLLPRTNPKSPQYQPGGALPESLGR